MSNASTIRRQVAGTQVLTLAPLTAAVAGTTATAFALNANPLVASGGGYNGASNSNTGVIAGGVVPLSAGVTGLYSGTGQVLHIAATGYCTGLATSTLTLTLYQVPASLLPIASTLAGQQTFTSWNSLGASSAIAIGATTQQWTIDARLQLGADGQLEGQLTIEIAGITVKVYAASTIASSLVGEADLNFVVVATAGTANITTNTMSELRLDLE